MLPKDAVLSCCAAGCRPTRRKQAARRALVAAETAALELQQPSSPLCWLAVHRTLAHDNAQPIVSTSIDRNVGPLRNSEGTTRIILAPSTNQASPRRPSRASSARANISRKVHEQESPSAYLRPPWSTSCNVLSMGYGCRALDIYHLALRLVEDE
ncbi:hypothetical protein K491DRAFT_156486 [Lophiostoma macrostomum CBS 122681]|uniref:Uncharacterized protein n=1 Tax=Lophiostoma macrostomum CBS 122681 TaxID=1314788 RepID=A0A6A6SUW8_9PLEO|nr:hypothetical protein K491DRAFT_156486 [Lophiostoma macrostomum CBS 122681]